MYVNLNIGDETPQQHTVLEPQGRGVLKVPAQGGSCSLHLLFSDLCPFGALGPSDTACHSGGIISVRAQVPH